jgi:branched-chain amino acid transport system permease protein
VTKLDVLTVAASWMLILTLTGTLAYTRLGRLVRAVRVNPEMSLVVGIDPRTVYLAVFAVGSFLGGIAAVLDATKTAAVPDMGFNPLFYAFVVVFLAGLGSSPLVVGLVGLVLGWVQSWAALFMPDQWTALVVFVILFVYVALRPLQLSAFRGRFRAAPA